jgi:endonuclease YncB( thermonuclease family)
MVARIVIVMIILFTGFNIANAKSAKVITIFDGDTIAAEIQGEKLTIKLYGIDAPESGQHGNASSTRFLQRLILDSFVEIEVMGTDVFGRTLAILTRVGWKWSVNAAVVANGYAWVKPTECKVDACIDLKKLEAEARLFRLGIWSGFNLVPPWEFNDNRRNR